ncbi:N-lysine methyltransferase SMYD2 [Talaromyces islandicus]|uniref:N-lysine methyltransferase SMYD2 n=1 Tax=Talaromyces islandicus TaxID=28573 RepID=A0A0U1M9E0_TALIS|nr:N-lysine methyltransferase SMYD2 [Talaromyces islandicus]
MGTGLFTLCPITTPGTELFSIATPLTAVLDSARLADTCAGCYDSRRPIDDGSGELKACTRCRVVRYCGRNCQLKDWRFAHSLECSIFGKLHPRILPNNVRAVLRIVLRYKHKKCTADEFQAFLKLSHAQSDQQRGKREDIRLAARAVKEYSGVADMDEGLIASLFTRLDVNTFNLVTYDYTPIGLYLDPYSSLMNHSCAYNAIVVFDGDRMTVKSTRPMRLDEQVFVSYIDTTYCVSTRRRQLRQRYGFECECVKCTEEARSGGLLEELVAAEAAGEQLVATASQQVQDDNARIQKYTTGLNTIRQKMPSSSHSHLTKQPLVALRNELIVSLINAARYDDAWIQCAIEYLKIDPVLYPHRGHPLRRIHAWRLAKLTASTDQAHLARRFSVDPAVVLWHVLQWLVDGESEACSAPLLQAQIRAMYAEVSQMGPNMRMEWPAVEERLEDALQSELAMGVDG